MQKIARPLPAIITCLIPSASFAAIMLLDNRPIWNGGVFDDDCDAILDDPSFIFSVCLLDSTLVDNLNVGSNAGILVDYALPHDSVSPCQKSIFGYGNLNWQDLL